MENNSIRKFTCDDCLEVSEVDWSKVRPDLDDGTSNIEIHAKGNDYAYYGECMNCGNLVEIEPPAPDLYVSNVDVDKSGISIEITDKVTNRSLWIDAWKNDNEEDWEYDFNQYIFHLDNENDIVAKMFQEDLGNYSEEVFDCVMGAIDDYEEEYNKLQENKAPTMRDRLKEAKFKDKVKAIKKSLKKNDKRLSDKTAEKSAEKIAGSMIKKEEAKYVVYDYAETDNYDPEDKDASQYTIYNNETNDFYYDEKGNNPVFDTKKDAQKYIRHLKR